MLGTHGTYSRSSSSEGSESTAGTPTMRFATVLLNGLQMIKCRMPDAWRTASVTVPAEEVNMTGDRGGLGLDVLLMIPTAQSAPRASETPRDEWKVTLTAACICEADGSETKQTVELGSLRYDTAVAQTGCYLTSPPKEYTVTLHHQLATHYFPPVEQQLVRDIESSLRDPKLARPDSGSLSSVLLHNKVKKSVSYERVVKDTYQSSWLDFIRAHSRVFHVFFYSEEQIKDGNLAPQIKKGDARVCLRGLSEEDVYEVDCLRCRQQKKADEGTRAFLTKSLSLGAMSQVDLVEKLKGCKPFADALHPTFSLLMRFVARHASTFVWISDPDQPTRGFRGS
ncbi:hypothetical protein DIPPA_20573 [Diplonema papillatum]|nr:hypothetical protein DIPPA_20573 [Diplonema papillatum]